jgi:FAD:protein FMN transferase
VRDSKSDLILKEFLRMKFLRSLVLSFFALNQLPSVMAETFSFCRENVLGTSFELRLEADPPTTIEAAAELETSVLQEIDRLGAILSTYSKDSEISKFLSQASGMVPVSEDLYAVLAACDHWETTSSGAFSARVECLSEAWVKAAAAQREPSADETANALQLAKSPAWKLGSAGNAERLGAAPVTVSALAKGYIIAAAGKVAYQPQQGIHGVVLNIGGDLQAWGTEQQVNIAHPQQDAENAPPLVQIVLQDQALATSGNYRRGTNVSGKHHSHILDPRTGSPADLVLSASVIAPDAATADALATICSVLAPTESLRLIESQPAVACYLVTASAQFQSARWPIAMANGGWSHVDTPAADVLVTERTWTNSEGKTMIASLISATTENAKFKLKTGAVSELPLTKLSEADQQLIQTALAAAAAGWSKTHELNVNYEINPPEGKGKWHRPYIAIWIEDKDGAPIRTLTLLMQPGGKGMKYLPDLKRWVKSDKARKETNPTDLVPTISSATRNAGNYSAVWDGLNNAQEPVTAGTYTLYIEAAREHGTYQLIKKEITVGGNAFEEKLSGNEEIKTATVEYRKKVVK